MEIKYENKTTSHLTLDNRRVDLRVNSYFMKKEIVERLLKAEYITFDEALELMVEQVTVVPYGERLPIDQSQYDNGWWGVIPPPKYYVPTKTTTTLGDAVIHDRILHFE